MAYHNPTTMSGHNMFEMASMLQKAIRRGDFEKAGYAAYELYGGYGTMMWNRILTISAEDCWEMVTKELIALRHADETENKGKRLFDKDTQYVSRAIHLLCGAKKSRDACYFACNFILTDNVFEEEKASTEDIQSMSRWEHVIPDNIFNLHSMVADKLPENEKMQMSLLDVPTVKPETAIAVRLMDSITWCDMEQIGHNLNLLRFEHRDIMWKTLIILSVLYCNGVFTKEIIGLRLADEQANKNRTKEMRDEIFVSKAIMLLCYEMSGRFCSEEYAASVDPFTLIDWSQIEVKDISKCVLEDGQIPEWVFDVHTIRGKKMGKTDWGMNIVEQAALTPLQRAFFDDGSWAPRYDYKHAHNMCTEKEYLLSLEYRKTRDGNPVARLEKYELHDLSYTDFMDSFSKQLYANLML